MFSAYILSYFVDFSLLYIYRFVLRYSLFFFLCSFFFPLYSVFFPLSRSSFVFFSVFLFSFFNFMKSHLFRNATLVYCVCEKTIGDMRCTLRHLFVYEHLYLEILDSAVQCVHLKSATIRKTSQA